MDPNAPGFKLLRGNLGLFFSSLEQAKQRH